ncbi:MAG: hypothetical protein ABIF01_02590, partial [Candidatus Micrarchaeota archaeon]
MIFPYEQDLAYSALLGNGRFNATLVGARFSRFFHPIDVPHDVRLRFGIYEKTGDLEWLEPGPIKMNDGVFYSGPVDFFIDSSEPVLAIRVKSETPVAVHWAMRIGCTNTENSAQFTNGMLAFFRRANWFGMKAPMSQHSCGHELSGHLENGKLDGSDVAMKDCEVAAILEPNPEIFIAAGNSIKSVGDTIKRAHYIGFDEMLSRTRETWKNLEGPLKTSSFVLALLQGESGAVLAAPEFDPEYRY